MATPMAVLMRYIRNKMCNFRLYVKPTGFYLFGFVTSSVNQCIEMNGMLLNYRLKSNSKDPLQEDVSQLHILM